VLASFSYRLEGLHPGLLEGIAQLKPEHLAGTPFEQDYARVAPNPGDWPKLIEKIKQMDTDVPRWTAEDVRGLTCPTMLIIGDSDIVQPEHAVESFRLLGGGVIGDVAGLPRSRLAVLPGTTHITLVQRTDWLAVDGRRVPRHRDQLKTWDVVGQGPGWGRRAPVASQAAPWRRSVASWRLLR
jgi:pimeloyl-ACP methyl ester carboxylesterase